MKAITIRNIPEEVARLIEATANDAGLSLNRAVIRLLREQIDEESHHAERYHDLDYLAGSWSVEEAKEFERNLADSRVIDAELWT